jgi:hypothetical protein
MWFEIEALLTILNDGNEVHGGKVTLKDVAETFQAYTFLPSSAGPKPWKIGESLAQDLIDGITGQRQDEMSNDA